MIVGNGKLNSQYYGKQNSYGIYLIEHFTSLSLAEIGQLFKIDYSVVSQAAKRFEQKSKVNHKIEEEEGVRLHNFTK